MIKVSWWKKILVKIEQIQWMWELTKQHKTSFWAISTGRNWRNQMPEDISKLEWLKFGFDIDDDAIRENHFAGVTVKGEFELSNSTLQNIEVNPAGCRIKQEGCKLFATGSLGIKMENVMAIGDSRNDMAMIEESGLGVAMGNAQEIVKEAADWVDSQQILRMGLQMPFRIRS